jgi:hypothetical protein
MPKAVRNSVLEKWGARARKADEVKGMAGNLTDNPQFQRRKGVI